MLKEFLSGHKPSHFSPNIFVRSVIVAETIFWASQNLFGPIFAIFVATKIAGGNIETAASVISLYWIVRIMLELFSTIFFNKPKESTRLLLVMFGMFFCGVAQLLFISAETMGHIYVIYSLIGIGIGLAAPQRNYLFSAHLDKNQETSEWGAYDVIVFIGIAMATTLGGFIATQYGFKTLFLVSGIFCIISVLPYTFLYIKLLANKDHINSLLKE